MNDDEQKFIALYQAVKVSACIILNHVEIPFMQSLISLSLDSSCLLMKARKFVNFLSMGF